MVSVEENCRLKEIKKQGKKEGAGRRKGRGESEKGWRRNDEGREGKGGASAKLNTQCLRMYLGDKLWRMVVTSRKEGGYCGAGTFLAKANFIKKARELQKNIYFCFIDYVKAFDCVNNNKLEIFKETGITGHLRLPPENSVCGSGSTS